MSKEEYLENDEFNLKHYERIIVLSNDDEVIVDIENGLDNPVIVKDGYKVILEPIYSNLDDELYK